MASPFHYFRKRQKALLAIATVFIVFIFVIGSALDPGSGPDEDRGDQRVATWEGGDISARELSNLVRGRLITSNFVRALIGEGIRAGGQLEEIRLPEPLINQLAIDPRLPESQLESLALSTAVLSDAAEEAGITVGDEVINAVLDELGNRRVKSGDLGQILTSISGGNAQAAEGAIFSTMRRIMQAYFYQGAYDDAAMTVLPAQQWEAWKRTNERISLQVAVLPVSAFLSETPEPSDDQIESLYEEFKDREPGAIVTVGGRTLPSPDPGFAKPRKVKLAFLRGSASEWTEKLMPKVDDQEIADYYEANKDELFIKDSADELGGDYSDAAEDAAEAADDAADEAMSEDQADASPADEASADEAVEGEPSEDSGQETIEEAAGEDEPDDNAEAPSEEADDDQAVEEESDAPAAGDGAASSRRGGPFRLAAYQTEPSESEPAEAEPGAATEADSQIADGDDAAVDDESDANATEGGDDAAPSAAEAETNEEPAADEEGEEEEPVQYEPLAAVSEEIRREIARQKAIERIRSEMRNIQEQLRTRYSSYRRDVATALEKEEEAPPVPKELTNLEPLAEKYGYEAETTPLLTQRQLYQDTLVGQAFEPDRQEEVVAGAAFSSLEIGEPYFAIESMGDAYVVVKVEDEPREVPPLKDVRKKVVAAWQRIEAAKLAEKKAIELAAAVDDSERSFQEYLADAAGYQVIPQTDMFSWMSFGLVPDGMAPLRISEVPGLENVGADFMEKVFALDEGEVAAAMNFDHSAAYVVRVHSRERTEQELREAYLATGWNTRDPRVAMTMELLMRAGAQATLEGLNERMNFEPDEQWQRQRIEQLQAQ